MIYKIISANIGITIAEMAMKFIAKDGERKTKYGKHIDGDYGDFFERI